MRDDFDVPARSYADASSVAHSATVIQFPVRSSAPRAAAAAQLTAQVLPLSVDHDAVAGLIAAVADTKYATTTDVHRPSTLAALGAIAGFAAQQSLLLEGGSRWLQPNRAEHLDRLLLSEQPGDASLWHGLRESAHALGVGHLPDPSKLLATALRCVGTTQLGVVTLPLAHRLQEQPQTALIRTWARVRTSFGDARIKPSAWPRLTATACIRRVAIDHAHVPPHVAVRIVLQSAIAMALIEPRLIPGAAVKPDVS